MKDICYLEVYCPNKPPSSKIGMLASRDEANIAEELKQKKRLAEEKQVSLLK